MNRIKTKLTNDFHDTECYVMAKKKGELSHNQVRNAWRKLCGSPHCTCGDIAGCRPSQVEQTYQGNTVEENKYKII